MTQTIASTHYIWEGKNPTETAANCRHRRDLALIRARAGVSGRAQWAQMAMIWHRYMLQALRDRRPVLFGEG